MFKYYKKQKSYQINSLIYLKHWLWNKLIIIVVNYLQKSFNYFWIVKTIVILIKMKKKTLELNLI